MKTFKLLGWMLISHLLITSVCLGQKPDHSDNTQTTERTMKTQQNKESGLNFTSGYSKVNGLNMYYEIHGEGKPLV